MLNRLRTTAINHWGKASRCIQFSSLLQAIIVVQFARSHQLTTHMSPLQYLTHPQGHIFSLLLFICMQDSAVKGEHIKSLHNLAWERQTGISNASSWPTKFTICQTALNKTTFYHLICCLNTRMKSSNLSKLC